MLRPRAAPLRSRLSSVPLPGRSRPPPSRTSTGSCVSSSRSSATRASATTSSARRWTICGGDLVSPGFRENDTRQLAEPLLRDPAVVDRLRQLGRRREPEVRRDGLLERRLLAASVLAAGRGRDRRQADVVAAAPVAGDRAERREARMPAVGRDADAVDPGSADDRDAPALLRSCAQDRERVVVDDRPRRPAPRSDRGVEVLDLRRKVEPGDQQLAELGHGPVVGRQAGLGRSALEQLGEHVQRALEPEVVRRAQRPSFECEERAVGGDEREVGLRRAAVHGEERGAAHTRASLAARRSSISSLAMSHWPISGCASSALRASAGSPERAARTASRS